MYASRAVSLISFLPTIMRTSRRIFKIKKKNKERERESRRDRKKKKQQERERA